MTAARKPLAEGGGTTGRIRRRAVRKAALLRTAAIDGALRHACTRFLGLEAATLRRKFASRRAWRHGTRRASDKRTVADRIAVCSWVTPATANRLCRGTSRGERRKRGGQHRRNVLHAARRASARLV